MRDHIHWSHFSLSESAAQTAPTIPKNEIFGMIEVEEVRTNGGTDPFRCVNRNSLSFFPFPSFPSLSLNNSTPSDSDMFLPNSPVKETSANGACHRQGPVSRHSAIERRYVIGEGCLRSALGGASCFVLLWFTSHAP